MRTNDDLPTDDRGHLSWPDRIGLPTWATVLLTVAVAVVAAGLLGIAWFAAGWSAHFGSEPEPWWDNDTLGMAVSGLVVAVVGGATLWGSSRLTTRLIGAAVVGVVVLGVAVNILSG